MKRLAISISGLLLGSPVANAHLGNDKILVDDLSNEGFNQEVIVKAFKHFRGVDLELDEELTVTESKEGEGLNFETFDDISITIPITASAGPFNKF